jgi:hypothetical protein
MNTTDYKFFYVTKERQSNSTRPLECFGSHPTIEAALADQLQRAYDYMQKTSIYGVKGDNSIHFIS